MLLKFFLLITSFLFTFSSPPTNCKVCYGHFYIYSELKTDEEKIESIEKFCSNAGTPMEKWSYTYPFEFGILKLVKEKGINYAFEEFNKCHDKNRTCIKELCSNLSGHKCY